jgi:hypothetical protein
MLPGRWPQELRTGILVKVGTYNALQYDTLDLVERDLIVAAIVELVELGLDYGDYEDMIRNTLST